MKENRRSFTSAVFFDIQSSFPHHRTLQSIAHTGQVPTVQIGAYLLIQTGKSWEREMNYPPSSLIFSRSPYTFIL